MKISMLMIYNCARLPFTALRVKRRPQRKVLTCVRCRTNSVPPGQASRRSLKRG